MAKRRQVFICQSCGYESGKWLGKCPNCSAWNSFVEEEVAPDKSGAKRKPRTAPMPLKEVPRADESARIRSGLEEFDRVLGGGIFPASVVLLAGEPGIGKSTLMLQVVMRLQQAKHKCLYVSAEESLQQLRDRAERLRPNTGELLTLAETDVTAIQYHIEQERPSIVVMDSIQAIYNPEFSGASGNVGQVRECAARLFKQAKEEGFTLFLIGHVTKEGSIAGPKILEHLVDVVVYFEGNIQQHRIVRTTKNRFGAANELGVFEMFHDGLHEVSNISSLFLNPAGRPDLGSSIVCSYEGSRPLLVEVQALVSRSNYGTPQRTVNGFNQRRLSLILAVLERYCDQDFGMFDVFVKVAGGLKIEDPGIDFGVAAALYSSRNDRPLDKDAVYIGELGLGGEIRAVSFVEQRMQEAEKMGFKHAYIPSPAPEEKPGDGFIVSPVTSIYEVLIGRQQRP